MPPSGVLLAGTSEPSGIDTDPAFESRSYRLVLLSRKLILEMDFHIPAT
jgi:hypothetical protein